MQKLSLIDIKLKAPGRYIKEEIMSCYESLDAFADLISIYPNSLKKYLDSTKVGSAVFKTKLEKYLKKGYKDIVVTYEKQIEEWVANITKNIQSYKSYQDVLTLEKVKCLCARYNMPTETAKMLRNLGMYHFYNNRARLAIEFIKLSLDIIENTSATDLLFEYNSDLGLIYYYEHEYIQAKQVLEAVSYLRCNNSLDKEVLFHYLYRLGNVYTELKKYEEARNNFLLALNYHQNSYQKGSAVMNIGITHKREKALKKSLNCYLQSLECFDSDDETSIAIINNNIAELYREMGDCSRALLYCNKALEHIGTTNIQKQFIFFQTYTQIKIEQNEPMEAVERLLELMAKCKDVFTYRKHIVEAIEILIKYAINANNEAIILRLELELIQLIQSSDSAHSYVIELKSLLCDIYLYKRERR